MTYRGAINYYVVPEEDKAADGYYLPIQRLNVNSKGAVVTSNRLFVKLPLSKNTVDDVLKPIAKWLGLRNAQIKKRELVDFINESISLTPMSEVIKIFPELAVDYPHTFQAAEGHYYQFSRISRSVEESHPEFLIHFKFKMNEAMKIMHATDESESNKGGPLYIPEWWDYALEYEPPPEAAPYYIIRMEIVDDMHDGPCCERGALREDPSTTERKTVYLSINPNTWADPYTLDSIKEQGLAWNRYLSNHCCCGAKTHYRVSEIVEV
jgi:hypothetical protein